MATISIIIPVFNVETYLKQCLMSLINQTFEDIEIICINDGSTDHSPEILNDFANHDKRIVIVNQSNQGVSQARNAGINIAKGKYISFIDADDSVDSDFIEKLYRTAVVNNCDITAATIIRKREHAQKYRVHYTEEKIYTTLQEKINICDVPNCCYVWNKLYKSELVKSHPFRTGMFYEDIFWIPEILKQSDKLVTVPDTNYYYLVRTHSIVKTIQSSKKQSDSYNAKKYLIHFFQDNNLEFPSRLKSITKTIWYIGKFPLLKTKEYNEQYLKYYLFGCILIFIRKIPTVKHA